MAIHLLMFVDYLQQRFSYYTNNIPVEQRFRDLFFSKEVGEYADFVKTKLTETQRYDFAKRLSLNFPRKCLSDIDKFGLSEQDRLSLESRLSILKNSTLKKRQPILETDLKKAKFYIDNPSILKELPRASSGKTPVYLPPFPLVLKASGYSENEYRLNKMKQAYEICKKNGYENLIIPKAKTYENFIIETRLPIKAHTEKEQICQYIENRDQFTLAIQEFVGFLFQSSFYDLTYNYRSFYNDLSKAPIGRYDNVPLYFEKNQGKIGLIDLEKFSTGYYIAEKEKSLVRCKDAIYLFPYHFKEIMDVARKFDSNIDNYYKELSKDRDEALKRFKIVYEDHLKFIQSKGISFDNPSKFFQIETTRQQEIKEIVKSNLSKKCRRMDPSCIDDIFFDILNRVTSLLSDKLSDKCNTYQEANGAISSLWQLLSVRTLMIHNPCNLSNEVFLKLKNTDKIDEFDRYGVAMEIINEIFKELVNGKEICYYDGDFTRGLLIFC